MKKNIYYNARDLYFQFDNFTPIEEDDCGLYFLSSNTVMMCLSFLQHYGKWRNRYTYDLSVQEKQRLSEEDFDLITEIVDQGIKELMADACKSLEEIEFTLKHMLTLFSSNKQLHWFIDKPPEPDEINGNPGLVRSIYKSNLEYNIILDAGNQDNPGNNQLWGLGELLAKAFLKYEDSNFEPQKDPSIVVKSLLEASNGKSLEEIEYTLKTLLTLLGKDKEIKVYIDKPVAANEGDNATLEVNRQSVFEVGSLLETNNVTEVLQIALLDDGTLQLPDINPFNLESKIDTLNTNIVQHNTILGYFSNAFYGGVSTDWNPFFYENFFTRFSATFNQVGLLGGLQVSAFTMLKSLNQNVATSFNENYNTDSYLASDSYFRNLNTWLTTTWQAFHDLMVEIKDCICSIPDVIANLELSPTVNVTNNNSNPITVNNSDNGTGDSITNLGDIINNMGDTINQTIKNINNTIGRIGDDIYNEGDNVITTIDNGDDTYTTTITKPTRPPIDDCDTTPTYPPIDPNDPDGATTEPYKPVKIKFSRHHDQLCGFVYKTLSDLADLFEQIIEFFNPITRIIQVIGVSSWAAGVIKRLDYMYGDIFITKLGLTFMRGLASKYLGLGLGVAELIPDMLREVRDDLACSNEELTDLTSINGIQQSILNSLQTITGNNLVLDLVSYVMYEFYDKGLFNGAVQVYEVDMTGYAQYCPCPLTGLFNGSFWNGVTGNGEKWLYLSSDGTTLTGYSTSIDVFGTLYESEIVNGLIDPNNELAASGTLHVISHNGFPDVFANFYTEITTNEVSYSSVTYTRV